MILNYSFISSINIVSVLYMIFFVTSLVMGVFVYTENKGSGTGLVFLLLAIALAILHLGEVFFSWSDSKADAFAFTAVKSIGFVFWWPLSLHLFLSIKNKKLKLPWILLLTVLYLYSAACVTGFFLGINRAADYVRVGIVWIDKPYWAPLAVPYLLMIPLCLVLDIIVLVSILKEARKNRDELRERQIGIILFSGIPMSFLGLFFNIVMPNLGVTVPSIGHMFIGFWILATGYAITKYRFLVPTLEFASKQVFTIAGEIIVITDMKFGIIEFNQAFTDKLGFRKGEAPGLLDLAGAENSGAGIDIENVADESIWRLKTKNGEIIYLKKKAAVLYDNDMAIGIVFVLSDVSNLKNENTLLEKLVDERTKEIVAAKEEAERRLQITEVYTRRSVVAYIQNGGDPRKIDPQDRVISVMFADIRNFTGLSEKCSPMETVVLLNSYFDVMNRSIIRNGGEIDKLIGDCIMALFGDVRSSVAAAIDMRILLREFNANRPEGMRVNNGIGINYGKVVTGNIGSSDKFDYTVIGDVVNAASRIESLTKMYGLPVLVSEDVWISITEDFSTRFVDTVLVKGKRTPLNLYEVYDHEAESVRHLKDSLSGEYAQIFGEYRQGRFETAEAGYKDIRERIGEHAYLKGRCRDPLIDFYIDRCARLNRESRAGLLSDWNGVYQFREK